LATFSWWRQASRPRGGKPGTIEISSLAPHGLGHRPRNLAEAQAARQALLAHLENYQRLIFLESTAAPDPERPELAATRYNLIDVPKEELAQRIAALQDADLRRALRARRGNRALEIPIVDERGQLFSFVIGGKYAGVRAVSPRYYRRLASFWVPPLEVEYGGRQEFKRPRPERARDRKRARRQRGRSPPEGEGEAG